MDDLIYLLTLMALLLWLLCIGGFVADIILPHCKWLNDWIDTLPMMQNDDESP